ncbi:MAG: DUF4276 family protein [Alphaproteobacteria bacterium]|uniref:DUF4276 family protein n=1 Tax=Candidatus Nitrobium versatile TaxID=2884831 RepID=A0A953J4M4_9BACT|nr:DUF4276 family protein [Candidatus Nitrobium versatile]
MKIGMIFECGPSGADKKVCEHLAKQLLPSIEIISVTLDNKPKMIAECGIVADKLFKQGCRRVIIIWDLYPAWREKGQNPCRAEDRTLILDSMRSAGVRSNVHLVCIEEELEAWLLSDGRAISSVLSRPAHPVRVADVRCPETISNPKKRLNRIFSQHRRGTYNDIVHAIQIATAMPDLNRLGRCTTFARFAEKLTGTPLS